MVAGNDILLLCLIYLGAGVIFFLLVWRNVRVLKFELLGYMFRGLLASLIFTPWFVNTQETILAPALMVALLDLITLGYSEIFRAGVPLLLSIFVVQVIAIGLYIFERKSDKRATR